MLEVAIFAQDVVEVEYALNRCCSRQFTAWKRPAWYTNLLGGLSETDMRTWRATGWQAASFQLQRMRKEFDTWFNRDCVAFRHMQTCP